MPNAYWNGKYCEAEHIALHPRDLGVLRGYAIFDVMPVFRGRPFLAGRHFHRLRESAEALRLTLTLDERGFSAVATELARANHWPEATIRTVVTGGPSRDTFRPVAGSETLYVLAEPRHAFDPAIYRAGVGLVTLEYERPLPRIKFANHAVAIRELPARAAVGAFETLYVKDGAVSECSQSSLFWVKDGVLSTTWDNTLWGITQGIVLELAVAAGRQTKKATVTLSELSQADEVFITGSSKGVVPVVAIDGRVIGDGVVGTVTRQCMRDYQNYVASDFE